MHNEIDITKPQEEKKQLRIAMLLTRSKEDEPIAYFLGKYFKSVDVKVYMIISKEVPFYQNYDNIPNTKLLRAEERLNKTKEILNSYKVSNEKVILLSRDSANSIIDLCKEYQINILVLPSRLQERYGEMVLADNADYILKNTDCMVWLIKFPEKK